MPRAPSNKALVALALLKERGEMSCLRLSEVMAETAPSCLECGGTGDGDYSSRNICRRCHGRGRPWVSYSDAYQALKQLAANGLVQRREVMSPYGDPTGRFVWWAVDAPPTDDPLELLYNAPTAERNS